MQAVRRYLTVFVAVTLLVGCGDRAENGSDKVDAVVLDYDGLMQLVNEKKGRVVVIDVWATW